MPEPNKPEGLLLIDKPLGWTSHDLVAKVRNIIKSATGQKIKVGHCGTLDPQATGLMLLVVGSYTKKAQQFSKLSKTYATTIKLGETSSTGDVEGQKTQISDLRVDDEAIKQVFKQLTGKIKQVPPIYSAVKLNGRRAYQLARQGQKPKLEPREVTIHNLGLISYQHPFLKFEADVSSGTYIRALAEDIGSKLGSGAFVAELRRTAIGQFKLADSLPIGGLALGEIQSNLLQI